MGTAPVEINAGSDATVLSWVLDADPGTVQQAQRTARSPVVSGPLALMPDAHVGVGSTIGSVIPTEAAIIPAAVGVDLGCGMSAIRTTHTASQLPDDLHSSLDAIANAVPAGFESHDEATPQARDWLRANPLPDKKAVANKAKEKMGIQLGTLGGGNHFIELSLDNDDNVWVVLHSGSRGIGNMLATSHIKTAQKTCKQQGRDLEDNDLAYFTDADDGFAPYVADMLWAQSYAKANRKLMADAVLRALRSATGLAFDEADRVDCHHNYAEKETHHDKTLWITRKGAIRAGPGDRGVIPGSMGDDTYIVTGKGCAASYHSSAHGAGRLMSRRQAKREINVDQLIEDMAGRTWQAGKAERLLDEAPTAYRRIADVMAAQQELVDVDHKLTAVLNYKGC
ncbi:RtcB family protein [Candidatus Poriferisocius sp.]|uniref:RtcB family protein n=1 Tax=Candidatus Poriferisocius sp. TaxID=3101276 RepID=UPI003B5BB352